MAWLASKPPRTCLSPLLGVGIPSIGAPAQASVSGWEMLCWLSQLSFLLFVKMGSCWVSLPWSSNPPPSSHRGKIKHPLQYLETRERVALLPRAAEGNTSVSGSEGTICIKTPTRSPPPFFLSVLSLWPCSRLVLKQWNPPTEPNSFKRQNLSEEKNLHCFAKKFLKQPPIKSLTYPCAYFPKENEISFQNYLLYKRQWKFTGFCLFFTRRNFWQAEKRPVTFKDILIFH